MITKELIKNGIRTKSVRFVTEPNMEVGTVCQIGDCWFYFGGWDAEELTPEEYTARVPEDDIVDKIFDTLDDFRKHEDFQDEYNYYEAVLLLTSNI